MVEERQAGNGAVRAPPFDHGYWSSLLGEALAGAEGAEPDLPRFEAATRRLLARETDRIRAGLNATRLYGLAIQAETPLESAFFFRALLHGLAPAPAEIRTWADLVTSVEPVAAHQVASPRNLFQTLDPARWQADAAAEGVAGGLAAWSVRAHAGFTLRLLLGVLSRLPALPEALRDSGLWGAHADLASRLQSPSASGALTALDRSGGLLLVSAHTAFVHLVRPVVEEAFPDRLRVAGVMPGQSAAANAVPIQMYKTLSKGGVVHVSPDGGQGAAVRWLDVWGLSLPVGMSFAWAAHRSGAALRFVVPRMADPDGTGLRVEALDLPSAGTGRPFDDYADELAAAYGDTLRAGLLRSPLDYGIPLFRAAR